MTQKGSRFFVSSKDVESLVFDWGVIQWLSSPRVTGVDRFSTGTVFLKPGKGHAMHEHPGVEEIIYILEGEADQIVQGERRRIGPGDLVYLPAGVPHETMNVGSGIFKALAVYSPAGPEEGLREDPEVQIVPPGKIVEL